MLLKSFPTITFVYVEGGLVTVYTIDFLYIWGWSWSPALKVWVGFKLLKIIKHYLFVCRIKCKYRFKLKQQSLLRHQYPVWGLVLAINLFQLINFHLWLLTVRLSVPWYPAGDMAVDWLTVPSVSTSVPASHSVSDRPDTAPQSFLLLYLFTFLSSIGKLIKSYLRRIK